MILIFNSIQRAYTILYACLQFLETTTLSLINKIWFDKLLHLEAVGLCLLHHLKTGSPTAMTNPLVNTSPLKRISDVVCFSKDQRCHGPKATLIEPSGFGPLHAASQTPKNRWHEESTGTIETPMHPNLASCKDGQQWSSTCFACGRCIVNMSWCLFDTASKGFLLSGIDAGFKLQTITTWNCHWLSQASMAYGFLRTENSFHSRKFSCILLWWAFFTMFVSFAKGKNMFSGAG